jgi:hypothetical protein
MGNIEPWLDAQHLWGPAACEGCDPVYFIYVHTLHSRRMYEYEQHYIQTATSLSYDIHDEVFANLIDGSRCDPALIHDIPLD